MPVFVNEVVFRGDVQRAPETGARETPALAADVATREALIAEVTRAAVERVKRELERMGER